MNLPGQTDRPHTLRAATAILIVMALGLSKVWWGMAGQPGIDLYQFWGIAKCQRSSGNRLGSPYLDPAAYQTQLWKLAQGSADRRLAAAVATRQAPDLTGTPLIYYTMGSLPSHYGAVLQAYRVMQFAGFVFAVLVLARSLARQTVTVTVFSAAVAAAFVPLFFELSVGNVNCIQLIGMLLVAETIKRGREGLLVLGIAMSCCLASLLVFLSLAKPNFDSATLLLGLCLAMNSQGNRLWMAASALVAGALLLVLPCLLFHTWSVWGDWWIATFTSADRIAFPARAGNYSGIRMLADTLGTSIFVAMALVGSVLLLSFLAAVLLPVRSLGDGVIRLKRVTIDALLDPHVCLAGGVLLTFALSPLVWSHYQVLELAPALWLCRQHGPADWLSRASGWLSIALIADLPANINIATGVVPAWLVSVNHGFSWVMMWLGLMLSLRAASAQIGSIANADSACAKADAA
jgi:hypothetical protein